jgi:glycosyltransferase involved in cell wall biosynthesis
LRIVVNDIAASTGGALSILTEFYNFIKTSGDKNDWVFLLGDNYLKETETIKIIILPQIKASWIRRVWFDFFSGKRMIKNLCPDVVFSLQNTIIFGLKIPQILYVHQSIPFQNAKNFSFFKKNETMYAIYQHVIGNLIKLSCKKADKIIVQTKWIKNAIIKKCHKSEKDIISILPSVKFEKVDINHKQLKRNEFFYPAGDIFYKNHECILQANKILNEQGISDFSVYFTIKGNNTKNTIYLDYITRELVKQKYNECTLIFPSYIESFGYPLAEARLMGTIILASDCEFSREILDGYENAYFFDPFKPKELSELMKKVIEGVITIKNIKLGIQNSNFDSWGLVVGELLKEGNRN